MKQQNDGRGRLKKMITGAVMATVVGIGSLLGGAAPAQAYDTGNFKAWSHIEGYGWTDYNGTISLGLRLEAVRFYQKGAQPLCARAHVANIGWQAWHCTSTTTRQVDIGTTGRGLAIEAIQMSSPGRTVGLSAHIQDIGNVASTGTAPGQIVQVGTTGRGLRMESFSFAVNEY